MAEHGTGTFQPWQSLLAALAVAFGTTAVELFEDHGLDTFFCPVAAMAILAVSSLVF